VVVVGHAFGQRVARMVAAAHPGLVQAVIMVAAGGKAPQVPAASAALTATFDESLSNEALPQTDEACFVCGSDRQFMTSSGRTRLR
jgi:pimeloyl-ACP methyl ester carboxylesterase